MDKGRILNCCCQGESPLAILGDAAPNLSHNRYLYIEGKDLQLIDDDPRIPTIYVPINFCPVCGQRLEEKIRTITA